MLSRIGMRGGLTLALLGALLLPRPFDSERPDRSTVDPAVTRRNTSMVMLRTHFGGS